MTSQQTYDLQGQTCAGTQENEARNCRTCGDEIPVTARRGTCYCSRDCQHNSSRDMVADLERELKSVCKNIAYGHLNRDRSIGFDGRYEGPLNQPITVIVTLRKDPAGTPRGVDCPTPKIQPHYGVLTPEDHDWAQRQKAFPHSDSMPRAFAYFCAACTEMVIDGNRSVRVTRGVYLPKEHQCGTKTPQGKWDGKGSIRVFDLQGKLLEVKSL